MSKRMIKCQTCGKSTVPFSQRFDDMEVVTKTSGKGKQRNLYYHKGECWEKEQKRQSFVKQEKEELDSLTKTMMRIHRRKTSIPHIHYQKINDLRNGTERYRRFWTKRYKEGVPYKVIEEAYKLSQSAIEYARSLGRFKNTDHELAYSFKIVCGKLEDAYKKIERSKEAKKFLDATESVMIQDFESSREHDYSRFKRKRADLSDIFGDD